MFLLILDSFLHQQQKWSLLVETAVEMLKSSSRECRSHSRSSSLPSLTLHLQRWHPSGAGAQQNQRPDSLTSCSKGTGFLSRVSKVKAFLETCVTEAVILMDYWWLRLPVWQRHLIFVMFVSVSSFVMLLESQESLFMLFSVKCLSSQWASLTPALVPDHWFPRQRGPLWPTGFLGSSNTAPERFQSRCQHLQMSDFHHVAACQFVTNDPVKDFCHLTLKAAWRWLIGRSQPLQVSVCVTVAGGKDARAEVIRWIFRILKDGKKSVFSDVQRTTTSSRLNHTFSDASIWEVSEQLKQDGGSSRGSGEGVLIVVPTGTSEDNVPSAFKLPKQWRAV